MPKLVAGASAAAYVLVLSGFNTAAATFVCDTRAAYNLDKGTLSRERERTEIATWPIVTFDDNTGILKYGREATADRPARWTEERLIVVSKAGGNGVTGHYMHNGSIFSALHIRSWSDPPEFLWFRGGNSDILTGTCRMFGN